jgi:NMD protein affecting ribosome stability and mRNA decay
MIRKGQLPGVVIMNMSARFCMFCGAELGQGDLLEGCCIVCYKTAKTLKNGRRHEKRIIKKQVV